MQLLIYSEQNHKIWCTPSYNKAFPFYNIQKAVNGIGSLAAFFQEKSMFYLKLPPRTSDTS